MTAEPMLSSQTVRGRTSLITGCSTSLTLAIGRALAPHGIRVILAGRLSERLRRLAEAEQWPAGLRTACVDTADERSVDELRDQLADEDISILVNGAGFEGPRRPLTDITPEQWDAVFSANVRGTYLLSRAFLPAMLARGRGDIVNLASAFGKRPLVNGSATRRQ